MDAIQIRDRARDILDESLKANFEICLTLMECDPRCKIPVPLEDPRYESIIKYALEENPHTTILYLALNDDVSSLGALDHLTVCKAVEAEIRNPQ
eukprot:9562371-Prorocentrum_lima.AAC.1